ncbi:MAG: hypothetical protein IKW74_07120, partial [Thermoguttaceae bacterium]|nr:hypothetical protein [Thermoguttaceae bacterium]
RNFPFLIAHLGIMILIVGCWITLRHGAEMKLTVSEGTAQRNATAHSDWCFQLSFLSNADGNPVQLASFVDETAFSSNRPRNHKTYFFENHFCIPFSGGVFNWSDYQAANWRQNIREPAESQLPESTFFQKLAKELTTVHHFGVWGLAQLSGKDRPGLLFDSEKNPLLTDTPVSGLKLELLDYATCADYRPALPVRIRLEKRIQHDPPVRQPRFLQPVETEPVESAETEPAEPAKTEPVESNETEPAEPVETEPAESNETEPAEPEPPKTTEIRTLDVTLEIPEDLSTASAGSVSRRGFRQILPTNERIIFMIADSQQELDAILTTVPERNENENALLSEVTLSAGGTVFHLATDTLEKLNDQGKLAETPLLEGTGYKITRFQMTPSLLPELQTLQGWTVQLDVESPTGRQALLQLHSELPERNLQAGEIQVFGSLWVNAGQTQRKAQFGRQWAGYLNKPRLEIIQGADEQPAFRFWDGKNNVLTGSFDTTGNALVSSGGTLPEQLDRIDSDIRAFTLTQFEHQDELGVRLVPTPFHKEWANEFYGKAKIRVSFEGTTETFWLRTVPVGSMTPEQEKWFTRKVIGKNHTLNITMTNRVVPLPFWVYVRNFNPVYEPGSSTPASFSSLVDLIPAVDKTTDTNALLSGPGIKKNVLIQMNRPGI